MKHKHLFIFCTVALVAWVLGTCTFIYLWPHVFYNSARMSVVKSGLGIKPSGVPVNTLYAMPTLASPSVSSSAWIRTGNRDTLYTFGALDLSQGPRILHVPDMDDRYYSIELVDPSLDIFADVGRRTGAKGAGDYLISGPRWKGAAPAGVKQIAAPSNSVMLLGRVLVEGDGDLSTAAGLTKQISIAPLATPQQ